MIIIGEKINGNIPSIADAIRERDSAFIQKRAIDQETAGANYIDICAGTVPEIEYDTLCWLIDVVQDVITVPICIDSPDPHILIKVFPKIKKPGLINSISLEGQKCDLLLPLLKDNPDWAAIALCCDNNGIAVSAEEKVDKALALIENAAAYDVAPHRLHIDPLVLAVSAVNDGAVQFTEAVRNIKKACPYVNVTAAISNVSFGMPVRKLVNTNFLTLAAAAGLDSIITDPLNRDIIGTIYAVEVLLGRDRLCRKYNTAYRKGKIGPVK